MAEKQICCCGSSTWTRVIAWFQIVGSVIATILWTLLGIREIAGVFELIGHNHYGVHGSPDTDAIEKDKSRAKILLLVFTIIILIAILNFVMGIVLLRGTTNRNPRQLHYWIVYAVIIMAVRAFQSIFEWFVSLFYSVFEITGAIVVASILVSLGFLTSAIEGFCLWVVMTHKKEIEASTGPVTCQGLIEERAGAV